MMTTKETRRNPEKPKAGDIIKKRNQLSKKGLETTSEQWKQLTPKQRLFCQLYVTDPKCFGNGTQAYLEAYRCEYSTAKVQASITLTNPNIKSCINEYLELGGYTNEFADKQLLFVMSQFGDLPSKMRAIELYSKLKWRITDKHEVQVNPMAELMDFVRNNPKA